MIIVDLEWNRGYDLTPLDEILQIGAVRLDRPGGPITDTFCAFIRPKVHKKLNRTAKALPEIRSALDSQLDFPTAYSAFLHWCAGEEDFAAWGSDDLDILAKNCAHWKLPPLAPKALWDLQTAFALTLGTKQNIALWWAAEYCQVPDCFTFHNALNDAAYSAVVSAWIDPEALALSRLPRWVLRYVRAPFPLRQPRSVGPYPSAAAALNAPDSRRGLCPICGEPLWIQHWHFHQPGTYYACVRCPGHGRFLCRLSLQEREENWAGELAIPAVNSDLLSDFVLASQSREYHCKGAGRRRRRSRGRGHRRRRPARPGTPKEKENSHE